MSWINDERAAWAEVAIVAFENEVGTDRGDALSDLLCDLMHWCDRLSDGQDFEVELARARSHYAAEIEEDGEVELARARSHYAAEIEEDGDVEFAPRPRYAGKPRARSSDMVEKAGTGGTGVRVELTQAQVKALSVVLEAANIRADQWQAVADGDVQDCIDELHEADEDEGAGMYEILHGACLEISVLIDSIPKAGAGAQEVDGA